MPSEDTFRKNFMPVFVLITGLVNACIRVGKDKEALSRAKQAQQSMPSELRGLLVCFAVGSTRGRLVTV